MIDLNEIKQDLPAGLEDKGVEFYFHQNTLKCLHNGQRYAWGEFPQWVIDRVEQDMLAHPEALRALIEWDLRQAKEQMRQYIICRFGGFDAEADISESGHIEYTEYFDCGRRGNCAHEGKLCSTIKAPNGILTKQEVAVLKLVSANKLNKEIADILNISEHTVSTHNQNIQTKIGVDNKLGMMAWAMHKRII